jgi:hypothetical protein
VQVGRFALSGHRHQSGDIHERLLPNNGFDWKDLSPGGSIAS